MRKVRVLVLRNGGTIEAVSNLEGHLAPVHGTIPTEFLSYAADRFNVELLSHMPLVDTYTHQGHLEDSTESGLETWKSNAHAIVQHVQKNQIEKVIVLMGTDTNEYHGNALTFMLEKLRFPILLTGSEVEWDYPTSDGKRNVWNALSAILQLPAGVFTLFGSHLLRACRAVKVHSNSSIGFTSPNYPPIAEINGHGKIRFLIDANLRAVSAFPLPPPVIFDRFADQIFASTITPDSSPYILEHVRDAGILLSAYGLGNLPKLWREAVADLADRIPIAITTQCMQGGVQLDVYVVGAPENTISCKDMTFSCSAVKLRWAIGKAGGNLARVKRLMEMNLRGELTEVLRY